MKQGFVKVAAATPRIKVADPVYNGGVICEKLEEAWGKGAKVIVFPELCITGYTCGDLFLQGLLLEEASGSCCALRNIPGEGRAGDGGAAHGA